MDSRGALPWHLKIKMSTLNPLFYYITICNLKNKFTVENYGLRVLKSNVTAPVRTPMTIIVKL